MLKTTGNDPYYITHQLDYITQLNNQKLHNNSPEKSQICPYAYLPSPIRVWPISWPNPIRVSPSHTRMLRVSLPHTRTNRDQTTFKTSSSSSIRVLPSAIRVPCHLIRVLPSAIRVWPETRISRSAMAFSATRSIQFNLPQSKFYTQFIPLI
jgi:hypothetical protein